jgi:transforming growth factor-beta-induced protein
MRKLMALLAMTLLLALAPAAQAQDGTIVDLLSANDDFSTLVAAVQAADLVGTLSGDGPFTVFAPDNGAFNTLLGELGVTADQLLADTDLLTSVLTYHVVSGAFTSTDIVGLGLPANVATVNGAEIGVAGSASGGLTINDMRARVVTADISASNGVIHIIDNVLVPAIGGATPPPAPAPADTAPDSSIVGVLASNPDFSTLVAAVQAAGLVDTLSGPGPFTVFAPGNGAFNTLLGELGVTADQLLADTDLLTSVLTYHVVSGEFGASAIIGLGLPTSVGTVNGANIAVAASGSSGLVLNSGRARVVSADINASNGVIHVIDNVLLP